MKHLTLLALLFVALTAQAQEVTVTGIGASADEALAMAKTLATEAVASTFVTSSEKSTNGKYSEAGGQYNGGILESYSLVNSELSNSGLYRVTIKAQVNTTKVNTVITDSEVRPSDAADAMQTSGNLLTRTQAALAAINKTPRFGARVAGSSFMLKGKNTEITYQLSLSWTPKWVDDIKALAATIDRPIQPHFWSPRQFYPGDRVVCIASRPRDDHKLDVSDCWSMPDTPRITNIKISAVAVSGEGSKVIRVDDRPLRPLLHQIYDEDMYLTDNTFMRGTTVIYSEAVFRYEYKFTVPTEELKNLTDIRFEIGS
jgi:hypothetical protein